MLAFTKWAPVLASSQLMVNVKLRVTRGNIRPISEYGMEVWGSADQSALSSLLQPLNDVVDKACKVACGVRAFADERAWERKRATYLPVLRAACDLMPMNAVCVVAHLRHDHKLYAAAAGAAADPDGPQQQSHRTRATAYAHMSLAHDWHTRVASWPALRVASLQDVQARTLNKRLRDEVIEVVSKRRCVVAAAAPSAGKVSSRGRARKRDGDVQHPMCNSLAPTATYPEVLKCSDAVAHPILSLQLVPLPFAHHCTFHDICRHDICEHAACGAELGVAGGACTTVEPRWRVIQHTLFSCVATCHHLCTADLRHDVARLLPEDTQEARRALERAQGCNLEDAELVATHCVPWLVHPTSQLPQVPEVVKKQVCSPPRMKACWHRCHLRLHTVERPNSPVPSSTRCNNSACQVQSSQQSGSVRSAGACGY